MDRENDYNPCLSPYDIQNGGIYDPLSNGQVIDKGQSLTEAFESYDCQSVLEVIRNNSFRLIQVGDCWINV